MKAIARLTLFMAFIFCCNSSWAEIIRDDNLYQDIRLGRLVDVEFQEILKSSLDPNAKIYIPETNEAIGLLDLAVRAKNEPIAMVLLEAGADIDSYSNKLPPLVVVAVKQGLEHVTHFVIENKPKQLLRIPVDSFPLAYAVGQGRFSLVKLLLSELEDDTTKYQKVLDESLILSISKGPEYSSISRILIDTGAAIEANKTLILAAAINGKSVEFLETAFKMGASPDSTYMGKAVLHIAIELAANDTTPESEMIVRKILEAGANPCFTNIEFKDLPEDIKSLILEFLSCENADNSI